ncbi:hypothetical protein [Burkholderia vietnamiensis]|uniref:hypothetical protein n=1 Tax=Burkholderia vietnamiensis TaxID=60552 RepID=UPI0012D9EABD|nr:hypothetical protein [Burkholderia vietnamiensis]
MSVEIEVSVPGPIELPDGCAAFFVIEVPTDDSGRMIPSSQVRIIAYVVKKNGQVISKADTLDEAISKARIVLTSPDEEPNVLKQEMSSTTTTTQTRRPSI